MQTNTAIADADNAQKWGEEKTGGEATIEILPPPFLPRDNIHGLRVLIIDPVRFNRDIIKSSLISKGVSFFVEAASVAQASKRLENVEGIDLIILDNEIGEENGLSFTKRIRHGETTFDPAIPVIMVCAVVDTKQVIDARNAGVHEFVSRPFDMGTLIDRVSKPFLHPRTFIRAPGYVGPDRRWERAKPKEQGRRRNDQAIAG